MSSVNIGRIKTSKNSMARRLLYKFAALTLGTMPFAVAYAGPASRGAASTAPAAAETSAAKNESSPPPVASTADSKIESLLDDLESADASKRDRAEQALIHAGPEVIGPLDARLQEGASPEVVSRGKIVRDGISRGWRYWDPARGKISGGFQATLLPVDDALTFKAGGSILLNLQMSNVSPQPRQLVDVRGFDFDLNEQSVFESPFCDGRVVIRRIDGAVIPLQGRSVVFATEDHLAIDVKTGDNVITPVRIDEGAALSPGDYEVRIICYAKSRHLLAGAATDLQAGPVRFKVVAAELDPEKAK